MPLETIEIAVPIELSEFLGSLSALVLTIMDCAEDGKLSLDEIPEILTAAIKSIGELQVAGIIQEVRGEPIASSRAVFDFLVGLLSDLGIILDD